MLQELSWSAMLSSNMQLGKLRLTLFAQISCGYGKESTWSRRYLHYEESGPISTAEADIKKNP